MLKTFHVSGCAVNKRGHTVGVHFDVQAPDIAQAKQAAHLAAVTAGYRYPSALRATGGRAVPRTPQDKAYG